MLRVMVVDDADKDLSALKDALSAAGCTIVAEESSALRIPARVSETEPDLIIIESESPTRDVLEQLCVVTQFAPRPIVMFSDESDRQQIDAAIRAGVTAYIVAGMRSESIRPILDVAIARFEQDRALRAELEDAKTQLAQRKLIEKAKGLLMAQRGCSEEEAFSSLRKLAMDRNLKLADVARQVIDVARLLG
jgi:response regulator NasT